MDALHSQENFDAMVSQWKEFGPLHPQDIYINTKEAITQDYDIGVNTAGSAFGQIDRNGQLQGLGREVDDFMYEGQFKNNLYHGWGRYICYLGTYIGYYENGLRNGQGRFISIDGQTQQGAWVNGILTQ